MRSRAFSLCAAATFYTSATLSAPPPKAPFIEQLSRYPQEKLYVHTDKEHYIAGDTVWLRAHCVDAATLTPARDSRYLYVELHDGSGALVRRIKILRRDGIYAGYLPLPDDAAGDYALCAYTLFMRNLPEDYLFRKPLRVGGLRDAGKSPREERRHERFDVSFFPEGGYLVNGHSCRVGFKALGDDGRPRFSEGWLLDDKGHFIDSLRTRHAGIGSVEFPPRAGRRYVAEFPDREGRLHRFELPEAEDYTFVLRVDPTDSTFVVSIRSGRNWLPRGLRLVVHRCGTQCYNKAWDPLVPTLTFRREELPEGLFQVLLLDEATGKALSERLVFNPGDELTAPATISAAREPGRRRKVTLDIAVRTPDGRPAKGDFSIAVTDRSAVPPRTAGDIYSTLVLSSELRGVIEEPDYYFDAQHADAAQALDELLLTQGWRRYDVPKLLRGEYEVPHDPLEAGQEIAGRVVPGNDARFRKRIDSYSVQLLIPRSGFATQTRIRPDGTFSLSGFDFPDSTTFVLRAARKGSEVDNLPIEVTPDSFPTFSRLPKPRIFDPRYADRALEYIDWRGSADIRNVLIDPIDVIHHSKEPDPVEQRMATRSYSAQQIKESGAVTLLDFLQRIPGMYLVGQRVWYRGKQPAFMIDGIVEYTPKMLMNYGLTAGGVRDKSVDEMKEELRQKNNPQVNVNNLKNHTFTPLGEGKGFGHDIQYTEDYDALPACLSTPLVQIKRVSIIEGANASFWGNNLKDGIIAITLKKGEELEEAYASLEVPGVALVTPLGYQTPAEFYSPAYETEQSRRSDVPDFRTTLYWDPAVQLDSDGQAQVEFFSSDATVDYEAIVEGVTDDGEIIQADEFIPNNT